MALSILQVASSFPSWGGTELHILNLSDQLRRRGHHVTVACRPGLWVEERARQMNLPTIPITITKQQDWRDYSKLCDYLARNQTDIVHVHWSLDIIVAGMAALCEQVPVRILSRHMPYPFKNKLGTALYSRLLFTRLVTVSASVRDTLVKCGVAPDKLEVIHHGTDTEAFQKTTIGREEIRRDLGVPEGYIAVGIAGRIAPEKGHQVLLKAAKLIGNNLPICYVVIGEGPDEPLIRASARDLGVSDRVIFAGFRDDINNAIGAMGIVVVPSTWDEPCSAVVQQAMALGKPVVGTRTGGTPEMIVDGCTGFLVPPADPEALAGALARLAQDSTLRRRMGEAGRARVESNFSLELMVDKIEALYYREYETARGAVELRGVLAGP